MKEEKGGEELKISGQEKPLTEGSSSIGIDDQIVNLEEQLQKAQNTLAELQTLKEKLEEERQIKLEKVQKEQEKAQLEVENKKLKEEINALKGVIGSLKNDLEQSAEQFQTKVANSLKLLEQTDASLGNEQITAKNTVIAETDGQKKEDVERIENNGDIKQIESKEEVKEVAVQQAKLEEPGKQTLKIEVVPVKAELTQQQTEMTSVKIAPEEKPEQDLEDAVLQEYRKIEKELEALEKGESILANENLMSSQPKMTEEKNSEDVKIAVASEEKITEPKEESKSIQVKVVEDKANKAEKKKGFFKFMKKDKKAKETKHEEKESKSDKRTGGLLIKAAVLLILAMIGGMAYQISNAEKLRETYTTQAKEMTVQKPARKTPDGFVNIDPEDKYHEAFAKLPFEETYWEAYQDEFINVKGEFPKNTSYKYKPLGSSNMWFVRNNGYLLKIEKIDSPLTPEQYAESKKSSIAYKSETTLFKGFPAYHLIQTEYLEVRGNIYYVKTEKNTIYKIWYKTFTLAEDLDDEKRVARMLDSLEFLGVKPPKTKKK
jgi:myosin heavy subunit